MKIYRGLNDKRLSAGPRSIAIGVFDGVHRGHRKILDRVKSDAKRHLRRSMVITFEPHPSKVLHPQSKHPILMSIEHRLRSFEKLGLDEALVIGFNKKFSNIRREHFLERALIRDLGMRALVVGHDFCFGHRGSGDLSYLSAESRRLGFSLSSVKALKSAGHIVSSTQIRRLIERGHLAPASRMLGRPVSVYGKVVRGRGRGRKLGYPTANLNPHHETLPPNGVYAAWGSLGGQRLKGVIHIGSRPTFAEKDKSVEVHFIDFHKAIYGNELELIFVKRLRAIKKFKDQAALIRAIGRDIRMAKKALS